LQGEQVPLTGLKVLVTGGAGFIGSHIVESLVRGGARVRVFDNFSSGVRENLTPVNGDVEVIEGDILDLDGLARAVEGMTHVSHQAAQLEITHCLDDPIDDLRTNTIGTLNVLLAARKAGVRKVVQASSACVYGQAASVPQREESHPTNPNWAYGVSKLAAEKYGRLWTEAFGIPVVSLRYAIIYGEREWYGRALTIFLRRLLDGLAPVVFGEGDQVRDFTNVHDLVRLHALALVQDAADGQALNVSTGVPTRIRELALLAMEVAGFSGEPVFEDVPIGAASRRVDGRMRLPSELQVMCLDPERAGALLGWRPRVKLSDGLRAEWDWLRENPHRWTRMSY
jgi:UDP-glucose 4-epimerase